MRTGVAHVATNRIHLEARKGVEDGDIDQVTCMDNCLAACEGVADLTQKKFGTVIEMGV